MLWMLDEALATRINEHMTSMQSQRDTGVCKMDGREDKTFARQKMLLFVEAVSRSIIPYRAQTPISPVNQNVTTFRKRNNEITVLVRLGRFSVNE